MKNHVTLCLHFLGNARVNKNRFLYSQKIEHMIAITSETIVARFCFG